MNHVLQICGEKDPEAVRFLNEILAKAVKTERVEAAGAPKAALKHQKERKKTHAAKQNNNQKRGRKLKQGQRRCQQQKRRACPAPQQPSAAQLRKAGRKLRKQARKQRWRQRAGTKATPHRWHVHGAMHVSSPLSATGGDAMAGAWAGVYTPGARAAGTQRAPVHGADTTAAEQHSGHGHRCSHVCNRWLCRGQGQARTPLQQASSFTAAVHTSPVGAQAPTVEATLPPIACANHTAYKRECVVPANNTRACAAVNSNDLASADTRAVADDALQVNSICAQRPVMSPPGCGIVRRARPKFREIEKVHDGRSSTAWDASMTVAADDSTRHI